MQPPPRIIEKFTIEWKDWLYFLWERLGLTTPNQSEPIDSTDSPYSADGNYYIFADATSGAITVNLPTTATVNEQYNIKKIDSSANEVTVSGVTVNIDGDTEAVIACQYDSITVYWDLSQYWII